MARLEGVHCTKNVPLSICAANNNFLYTTEGNAAMAKKEAECRPAKGIPKSARGAQSAETAKRAINCK